jgi:hypothetical protein
MESKQLTRRLKMIKTLQERLAKKKKEYKANMKSELILEGILFHVPTLYTVSTTAYCYNDSISVQVVTSINDIELIEIDLFDEFFGILGEVEWAKSITTEKIIYTLYIYYKKYFLSLNISVKFNDSCSIERVPTGKIKKVQKQVTVDEPEFEVVYNCSE